MTIPTLTEARNTGLVKNAIGFAGQRVFRVLAVHDPDALTTVLTTKGVTYGVPLIDIYGNAYPFCTCQSLRVLGMPPAPAPPLTGSGMYVVTCDFSTQTGGFPVGPIPGGPAIWRIDKVGQTEPVDHTIDGYPIQNVNEEPIDPPSTVQRTHRTLVAWWRVVGSDTLAVQVPFEPFVDKINLNDFKGTGNTGCFYHPGVTVVQEQNSIISLEARFEFRPPRTPPGISAFLKPNGVNTFTPMTPPIAGWLDVRINRGRRKRIQTQSSAALAEQKYTNVIIDGKQASDPVNLDALGLPVSSTYAVALVFQDYDSIDFNTMPIP